jgi:hypothetical protein
LWQYECRAMDLLLRLHKCGRSANKGRSLSFFSKAVGGHYSTQAMGHSLITFQGTSGTGIGAALKMVRETALSKQQQQTRRVQPVPTRRAMSVHARLFPYATTCPGRPSVWHEKKIAHNCWH